MRRYLLPLILLSLFLHFSALKAKELFIKMSFGLASGGAVRDTWAQSSDYYEFSTTAGKRPSLGMDTSMEFIAKLNPIIGFSLSAGYMSGNLNGSSIRISHPEMRDFQGDVFYSPKFSASINPFCLTAIFSLPVLGSSRWNFSGGVGYYLGKVECTDSNWKLEFPEAPLNWQYFLWRYESRSSSVGIHGGTAFDLSLPMGAFLSFEVLYRKLEFKRFKTSALKIYAWLQNEGDSHGGDSTFIYMKSIGTSEDKADIDYMVSNMDCSGFSFRLGLKFKF